MTPYLEKSSKNLKFCKNFFFLKQSKKVLIYVLNTILGGFSEFQAPIFNIRTQSFLKNFMTPDLQKSSKNLEFFKNFFLLETTKKVLIYVPNTILGSFSEFQAPIFEYKDLVIFEIFHDPGPAKKFKKFEIFQKIFFYSKQPRKS